MELLIVIGIVIVVFSIIIGMYVLVAMMAKHRHREVALWLLLSFIFSPLLIIIILLCIGEDETYKYRIVE